MKKDEKLKKGKKDNKDNKENKVSNMKEETSKKKSKVVEFFKGLSFQTKIIIILLIIIIFFVLVVFGNKEGAFSTISESSLQKVFEINELDTIEYTYNAITTAKTKSGKEKYHVSYEGKVFAGIDFSKVKIEHNKNKKIVTITLPEVEIHEIIVDPTSLDFIFVDDKYHTETVNAEAHSVCFDDLSKRIAKEEMFYESAKANAISSVEALLNPWIDTLDSEYEVIIK